MKWLKQSKNDSWLKRYAYGDSAENYPVETMPDYKEEIIPDKKEEQIPESEQELVMSFQNSMPAVSREFRDLLIPMAKYVLTKYINENPPVIASATSFERKIGLIDIPIDVDKTEFAMDDLIAFYNDKIITAFMKYGNFIVVSHGKTRKQAKTWMEAFEKKMREENQYRGKCLYAERGTVYFHEVPDTNWDDVVLDEKIKKDIKLNTVTFLGDKKLLKAGVTKRGIVMYGPPGTGKTSVVKAIFRELHEKDISRIYVTAESFKGMSISSLFDLLKYLGPSVLAFEDIDFVSGSRDNLSFKSDLLGELLNQLDGMRKYHDPLVVLASTNKIDMLDKALSDRPGRFDRKIELGLPRPENLTKIYQKLLGDEVDERIVELSKNFTGAHVVEVVNTARIISADTDEEISDCLSEACEIIRDNFFPIELGLKEAKAELQVVLNERADEEIEIVWFK